MLLVVAASRTVNISHNLLHMLLQVDILVVDSSQHDAYYNYLAFCSTTPTAAAQSQSLGSLSTTVIVV
jgi:hypothetical protein